MNDSFYMAQAIALAKKGWYSTMPNPRVGCVLVKNHQLIAQGWHERAGLAHAEVNALTQAGEQAKDSTAYVTLEPCSHTGRTGPCFQALIDAGVVRVVYGMQDPNPLVAGRGLKGLRDAGVEVFGPVCEADAQALNPGFIQRMKTGRGKITAKIAMSLDGRTAMASGESQWITGNDARAQVQKLRAQSGAIISGIDSVLMDDSALTVRPEQLLLPDAEAICERQPIRLLLDSTLRLSAEARILHQPGKTKIFYCQANSEQIKALSSADVELVQLPANAQGSVCLSAFAQWLEQQDYNDILLEAGAKLSGAFLQAGLIDELCIFMAAKLLGSKARPLLELPIETMATAVELDIQSIKAIGHDWLIQARPIQ